MLLSLLLTYFLKDWSSVSNPKWPLYKNVVHCSHLYEELEYAILVLCDSEPQQEVNDMNLNIFFFTDRTLSS